MVPINMELRNGAQAVPSILRWTSRKESEVVTRSPLSSFDGPANPIKKPSDSPPMKGSSMYPSVSTAKFNEGSVPAPAPPSKLRVISGNMVPTLYISSNPSNAYHQGEVKFKKRVEGKVEVKVKVKVKVIVKLIVRLIDRETVQQAGRQEGKQAELLKSLKRTSVFADNKQRSAHHGPDRHRKECPK